MTGLRDRIVELIDPSHNRQDWSEQERAAYEEAAKDSFEAGWQAMLQVRADRILDLLRDERAELQRWRELFAGGPDTPCRTTWREDTSYPDMPKIECCEVPMSELRAVSRG